MKNIIYFFCIILITLLISGCGGGGSGVLPQVTPTPDITGIVSPTPETGTGTIKGYVYALANEPESMVILTAPILPELKDYVPVGNVRISLMSDPRIWALSDDSGQFTLENVPYSQIGNLTILQTSHTQFSPLLSFAISNLSGSSSDIIKLYILPSAAKVFIGRIIQFRCFGEDSSSRLINPENVTWKIDSTIGTIYPNGLFVATAAGKGKITASAGSIKEVIDIEVISSDIVGSLRGKVTYSNGGAAKNVFVTANVISWASETDGNGSYQLVNIPSGERIIKVIKNGASIWEGNVIILQNTEGAFDIKLNSLPPPPVITTIVPSTASPGTEVSIMGLNFGSTQGDSLIKLGNDNITPSQWSNTLIKFIVPSGKITNSLIVNVSGQNSNSVTLSIISSTPTSTPSPTSTVAPASTVTPTFSPTATSTPYYKGMLVYKSPDITVKRYNSAEVKMNFKNTGNIPWDPNIIHLGTSNPYDRNSHLYTADGNWIAVTRIKMQQTSPVLPGGVAEFLFYVTPDSTFWTSPQDFELSADESWQGVPSQWFGSSSAGQIYVTVEDTLYYTAELSYKSPDVTVQRGNTMSVTIKFKNTGTIPWSPDVVHLGTSNPHDRNTHLYDSGTWINDPDGYHNRIKMLQTSPVNPGETAEFIFNVKPDGSFTSSNQAFELVADGIYMGVANQWFGSDGYVDIYVTVTE